MERKIYEWYVVYTRQGMELKVVKELKKRNIEAYCPVNRVEHRWWSLKKTEEQPLFHSYVFAKLDEKDVPGLRKINGVVNVLYWLGKPAIVKDQEIRMIRDFLCNHTKVSVEKTTVKTLNYVYGSSTDKVEHYKLELPTIGYRVIAGQPAEAKVVSISQAHKPVEMKQPHQYSNAG
ncbi:MAG TPA: UpxY family transcription antiterminator [Chitinophagaceae bacterium]